MNNKKGKMRVPGRKKGVNSKCYGTQEVEPKEQENS